MTTPIHEYPPVEQKYVAVRRYKLSIGINVFERLLERLGLTEKEFTVEYGEKLIGIIGIRADKNHICFFFVDGIYHRQGVGRRMFHYLLNDYVGKTITLNSSPYGVPFYKTIGFVSRDEEKTINGIRFTPMEYRTGKP